MLIKRKDRQRHKRMRRIERALKEEGFRIVAGIDESGRGPLAGPVVASAVVLKEVSLPVIIRDCKKLTYRAKYLAYEEILKCSYIGIGIVEKEDIDRLNIYQASLLAMREAVRNLGIKPDCLLIDGPYRISENVKNIGIIGGDSRSFCIACASIVAKVVRDKIMHGLDKLYPQYDFKHNKGYGTKKHFQLIEKFGPSPVHRLSFFPFTQRENKRKGFIGRKKEVLD